MKSLAIIVFFFVSFGLSAQEIGYISGASKMGINPARFQPVYGFTVGAQVNKVLAIETGLFYSQRSIGETIQADYLSFFAMPKIGFFGKKAAVYYSPGIALNPTLYHSNIQNHTYVSHIESVGGQVNIKPRILLDLKLGYDIGLTGAYLDNDVFKKYSGVMVLLGLKFRFNELK